LATESGPYPQPLIGRQDTQQLINNVSLPKRNIIDEDSYIEVPPLVHLRSPTFSPSPELPQFISPEDLRLEPTLEQNNMSESVTLSEPKSKIRSLSSSFFRRSRNCKRGVSRVDLETRKGDQKRQSLVKKATNRIFKFAHKHPLDDVFLVEPDNVTKAEMLEVQELGVMDAQTPLATTQSSFREDLLKSNTSTRFLGLSRLSRSPTPNPSGQEWLRRRATPIVEYFPPNAYDRIASELRYELP